eukprot:scaffold2360_cov380-Prasinococcus_capsulatus_cf.AAC.14
MQDLQWQCRMNYESETRMEAVKGVEEFCLGSKCRRSVILKHFGETALCDASCDICRDPERVFKLRRLAENNAEQSLYLRTNKAREDNRSSKKKPEAPTEPAKRILGRKDGNVGKTAKVQKRIDAFFQRPSEEESAGFRCAGILPLSILQPTVRSSASLKPFKPPRMLKEK